MTIQRLFTRKTYETRRAKWIDFAIGFGGLVLLNALMQWIVAASYPRESFLANSSLLINVVLLIYFGFRRHWIALGALAAIAAGLLLVLCLALIVWAICFAAAGGW
jgi:hypothetical protein